MHLACEKFEAIFTASWPDTGGWAGTQYANNMQQKLRVFG